MSERGIFFGKRWKDFFPQNVFTEALSQPRGTVRALQSSGNHRYTPIPTCLRTVQKTLDFTASIQNIKDMWHIYLCSNIHQKGFSFLFTVFPGGDTRYSQNDLNWLRVSPSLTAMESLLLGANRITFSISFIP